MFLSSGELAGILGDVYGRLGQHTQALEHLAQAAQMKGCPRNATSWRLGLAQGYIAAGDPGRGASLALSLLPEVSDLSSARIRSSVLALSQSLTPHARVAEVKLFQEHASAAGLAA